MKSELDLLLQLDNLHTTELGIVRIKRNLSLSTDDVVLWCKEIIQSEEASIIRKGKNWYVFVDRYKITINAYSYTIITAHLQKTSNAIKTSRLLLKPYSDNDLEDMLNLLTNTQIKKTYMIPDFKTHEGGIAMFHKIQEYAYSKDHYEYGIYEKKHLIGWVNDVKIKDDSMEVGYVIDPKYHNRGYATEVLKAIIQDIFQKGYRVLIAGAFASNSASFKVMQKCGMERIDKTEDIEYQNQIQHCIYYAIQKKQ